jgi:hypothetical protein
MLFSFQNVEEVIELLDKLTSSEKLELAKRIYIGCNQFDFIDSKGNLLDELNEETDLNNFYEELSNTFIKIYNTHKKVEKYLIQKLYEPCGDFNIEKKDVNKIDNFQDLDDRCAEIFEY